MCFHGPARPGCSGWTAEDASAPGLTQESLAAANWLRDSKDVDGRHNAGKDEDCFCLVML